MRGKLILAGAAVGSVALLAACAAQAPAAPPPVAGLSPCPPPGAAKSLTGAGATFPYPLYSLWVYEYKRLCRVEINYQSIGSGGGQRQFIEKTVDFGATDAIMSGENRRRAEEAGGPAMHIPLTIGAEPVVFNLPGLNRVEDRGKLRLTADLLADIYLGKLRKWNDPRIVALNPGLGLPNRDILVVHRSDGSGTTWVFTRYLAKVSPEWAERVGFGTSVQWPADGLGRGVGGKGNEGVTYIVRQNPGAIGYIELAYAVQNRLVWASLRNGAGQWVEPTVERASKAAEGIALPDDMELELTASANPDAYPIANWSWLLAYVNQPDPAKGRSLARFIWWAIHEGQRFGPGLGYAPLPADAIGKVEAQVRSLMCGGEPCLKE